MSGWTCPICGRSFALHPSRHLMTHGAIYSFRYGRSDLRLWLAVAFADEVAVRRACDDAIGGGRPSGLHTDDRLAAAVLCIRRGHRSTAVGRLGINGQTSRHMRDMVDNDLLPEIGSYELPPGMHYINNESDDQ